MPPKKKPSAWINKVKAYAKHHNISLKEAMVMLKGTSK